MSPRLHRRLFGLWFGVVLPPIMIGAFVIAFGLHVVAGLTLCVVAAIWLYDMGETTCSRCSSYGTLQCGLQGVIVPLLWKRRRVRDVSRQRVIAHFWFDVLMMALICAAYLWWGNLLVAVPLLWVGVAWALVYGPKRHHGLLSLLRQPEAPAEAVSRLSLPVITVDSLSSGSSGCQSSRCA